MAFWLTSAVSLNKPIPYKQRKAGEPERIFLLFFGFLAERMYLCHIYNVYMLLPYYKQGLIEAGCDEAGRGCLAGSVYAAAVIFPPDYHNDLLNDSKQLTAKQRYALRDEIERDAVAWALGIVTAQEIDEMNILRASITAMHRAIDGLKVRPQHLIVDGNRFLPYHEKREGRDASIPYATVVKGDGKYLSIAADMLKDITLCLSTIVKERHFKHVFLVKKSRISVIDNGFGKLRETLLPLDIWF